MFLSEWEGHVCRDIFFCLSFCFEVGYWDFSKKN